MHVLPVVIQQKHFFASDLIHHAGLLFTNKEQGIAGIVDDFTDTSCCTMVVLKAVVS